jgi:tripeptidyl-peptidase-1
MVQPTTFFGLRSRRAPVSQHREPLVNNLNAEAEAEGAVTGCSGSKITPACLSNLYGFASATAYTTGLMGIAGFLEEYPLYSDLKAFMASYATEKNTAQTFTCTLVNPATNGTCPQNATGENVAGESHGTEASLDVQYARAITESIPNVFYSTSGRPPFLGSGANTNEPYLEFLEYLLGLPNASLPNTLSISYGDDESSVPLDYATNVCNLFSQLGARGVSVLVASGDSGVGDPCTLNGKPFFTTSFPASCPWVTTVGGTTGVAPETAWFDSGGGFSEVFGRPSYQNATVNSWLSTDTTHKGVVNYFNASGRAYPDVSAQSTSFAIMFNGSEYLVDGTSCATPTFAGVVQLLNSDRLASGRRDWGS